MCRMCGGDPATGKPGCGFVVGGEQGRTERQRARKRQKRQLSAVARAFFEEIGEDPDELDPLRDTPCPTCGGMGFLPRSTRAHSRSPIDVYPSKAAISRGCAGSKPPVIGSGGGYCLAEEAAPLCGSVGRWLAELRAGDEAAETQHATVLEIYVEHFSEVPLWLLTAPGQKLVKRGGVVVQWARTLEQLLGALDNERNAQAASPDQTRGRLIEEASRQARALLEEAADCWNEVAPETDDEATEDEFRKAVGL